MQGVLKMALNYKDPSSGSSLSLIICIAILSDLSFFIYKMGLNPTCPTYFFWQAPESLYMWQHFENYKAFNSYYFSLSLQ